MHSTASITEKLARLVEERGWNLETFARQTGLHRNTLRPVLARTGKRLHNQTLRRCADALGLSVGELLEEPVEKLLGRASQIAEANAQKDRLLASAGQPQLQVWIKEHPQRAARLTPAEVDELLSLQGTGGALTSAGVEHFVARLERKRELFRKIEILAGTEQIALLEQLVDLMWERAQAIESPAAAPPNR